MRLLAALFSLLVAFPALGAANDAPLPPAPSIPFQKYRLGNGLEVILAPDKRLPIVAVNLWYHVGAANEERGRAGFAHLFEHMMFTGTKHIPRGLDDRLLEAAGVVDSNASTSFDRTNYFDTLPANQLELGLWIHSDRMGYLLDALDQTALSNQQDVVRNERRQTTENRPYGIVDEALFAALFPEGHPYRPAIIGSHADIQAAQLADVRDFFKRYYRPNNATLVIAGDFDPANARRLVQKYFGALRRGLDVPKPTIVTPPIAGERRLTVTDRIELPRIDVAWLTPPAFAPGDVELKIAAEILAGGKSSRLYKTLVYKAQLAQSVSADQDPYTQTGIFVIQALARPGHTPAELEAAIDNELSQLAADGPTQAEVDRARSVIEHRMFEGLEKLGGQYGVANRLNQYNQYTGDPGYLPKDIERHRRVTPDDVKRAVRTWLPKDARVIVYAERGEKKLAPDVPAPVETRGPQTESINVDEAWRRKPPAPGPEIVPRLLVPATFKLANGLTIYHLERPRPPVVTARLVVNAGLGANPPTMPGLADFALALLDEGTTTRNALQLADAFAQLGAEFSSQTARDASVLQVDALAAQFPAALALLADVALNPAFPAAEIDRQRVSRLAAIVAARDDPSSLADAAFRRALYGTAHPYGQTTLGTEASIKAIDRAALEQFWQRWFRPNNAALIVVGAIDRKRLEMLVEREWGAWTAAPVPARAMNGTPPPKAIAAPLVLVDKPGINQTDLRVGRVGAARSTPDFLALQVVNEILGGAYTSRLNANLRETNGFAYSAFSWFDFGRIPGPFAVATSVRVDATAAAVKEIRHELAGMVERPANAVEFAKARGALIRSLPGAFETNPGIAGSFANLFVYGLPPNYFATLPQELRAVHPADIVAAAKRYLDPAAMVVIGVGARTAIEPGLEALGLEPVDVWTPSELF
jgi:zinc protease